MTSTEKFSFDTIKNFDDHINQSIPNYTLLQEAIVSISNFALKKDTSVIDLGCSTGTLLKKINHDGVKIGVDLSQNLIPSSDGEICFLNDDIRNFNWELGDRPSLVLSIFTLQFLPKEDRAFVVKNIFNSLVKDGMFIWAEKVISDTGWQQDVMTSSYYDYKRKSFSTEEIMNKEKDLRSIMKCNTSEENQILAKECGFIKSQMFWKFFNFECWIYQK